MYAAWCTDDYRYPVLWSRSVDRGATWSPAEPLFAPTYSNSFPGIHLVAEGNRVLVAWTDYQTWPTPTVHFAISRDRGASWALGAMATRMSGCEQLLAEGQTIVWLSRTTLFVSNDFGVTWTGPHALARAGTNVGLVSGEIFLRLEGGVLHAAWTERAQWATPGWQPYYNRSTDFGRTWQPADRPLWSGPQGWSSVVDLIAAPAAVLVLRRSSNGSHVERSLDAGVTWSSTTLNIPTNALPRMAFDGEHALVAWAVPNPSLYTAWCLRSSDLGATWQAASAPLFTLNHSHHHTHWRGLHGGDGVFVLSFTHLYRLMLPWTKMDFTVASADGGATWTWGNGVASSRCHFGLASAPAYHSDRGALFAVWTDYPYLGMPASLSYDWLAGPRPRGGAAPVIHVVAPRLAMDEVPVPGFDTELHLRNARPGAPAIVTFGASRPAIPFLAGHLLVEPHAHRFVLLGGPSSSSPGSTILSFRLPASGLLSEFRCQAFVLDPAAAYGVAMSDGTDIRMF